jgi:hypothetical protein
MLSFQEWSEYVRAESVDYDLNPWAVARLALEHWRESGKLSPSAHDVAWAVERINVARGESAEGV